MRAVQERSTKLNDIWKESPFPLYSCIVFNFIWLTLICYCCILKCMHKMDKKRCSQARKITRKSDLSWISFEVSSIQRTMQAQKRWSQSTDALFWRKWCERIGRQGAAWPAQRPEYTFQPDPGWQKNSIHVKKILKVLLKECKLWENKYQ